MRITLADAAWSGALWLVSLWMLIGGTVAGTTTALPTTTPLPTPGGRKVFEAIHGPPPGEFVNTTHGVTHYLLEGPPGGPLVVLQHGLGGNTQRWDTIAERLVGIGCRVLRYDFYDRGYSESDPVRYPVGDDPAAEHPLGFELEVYAEHLADVLAALGLSEEPLVIGGHSLGGATAIAYAAKHPAKVRGLCLVGAVCLPAKKPLTARIARLPLLGPIVVRRFGAAAMKAFARRSCHDPDGHPGVKESLEKQDRHIRENPRCFAAIRSTNSHCRGLVGSAEDEFRECCRAGIPLKLIWGTADSSVPFEQCQRLAEIAREEGNTTVSVAAFVGMPHNVFHPDAKPHECAEAVRGFVEGILRGAPEDDSDVDGDAGFFGVNLG